MAVREAARRRRLMALAALTAALYAWPLALATPLLDPDEGLHAAIAQEMLDRGDLVVPRLLGEPFRDKPILYFWALAASLRLLGANEAAVRLPGLLFGWLGVLTTWMVARRLVGREAGELGYPLAATLALPLAVAQAAVHDVALVPWTNAILLAFWEADRGATPARTGLATLGLGAAIGLAILTKGLAGVALAGVPVVVWLLLERRLTWRMAAIGASGLAVGGAIAAPWYLAMERASPGYLHYFLVERHLLGFATPTQAHGERPWWYYGPIVLGGGWPWIVYLPFVRTPQAPDARRGVRLARVWLVSGLVLLSAARSKLVTYVLPVMPAVAVLAARAWHLQRAAPPVPAPRAFAGALWLHALVGVFIVPTAAWVARVEYGVDVPWPVWLAAALVTVGYGQALAAWRARAASRVLAWLVALAAVTAVVLLRGVLPSVAPAFSARDLASYFNTRPSWPAAVWVVDERLGSLLFYLDRARRLELSPERIEQVPLGQLWPRLRTAPAGAAVVIAERDLPRVARAVDLDRVPFVRAGRHRVYAAELLRDRVRARLEGRP